MDKRQIELLILTSIFSLNFSLSLYGIAKESKVNKESVESAVEVVEEVKEDPEPTNTYLGEYTITAYCSCEKCCGSWATKRPKDENGNPIVYGSSGKILEAGKSAASPLPFGSKLLLEDYGEVIVEDRTSDAIAKKIQ